MTSIKLKKGLSCHKFQITNMDIMAFLMAWDKVSWGEHSWLKLYFGKYLGQGCTQLYCMYYLVPYTDLDSRGNFWRLISLQIKWIVRFNFHRINLIDALHF